MTGALIIEFLLALVRAFPSLLPEVQSLIAAARMKGALSEEAWTAEKQAQLDALAGDPGLRPEGEP